MSRHPAVVLWTLVATQMVVALFVYGPPALGAIFRQAYGVSLGETGLLLAAPMLGLTVSLIGWGMVGDRFGERVALPLGIAAAAIGCVIAALADTAVGTGVGLLVAGLFGGVMTLSSRTAAAVIAPERRAEAMSALMMALSLGGAIGAIVYPWLEHHRGLDAPFAASALALVAMAAVLAVVTPATAHARHPDGARGDSPFRSWSTWAVSLSAGATMLGAAALLAFMPVYLNEEHGWSVAATSLLLAVTFLATAAARLVSGVLSDRLGRRAGPAFVLAVGAVAATLVLAAVTDASSGIVAGVLALAVVIGMSNVGLTSALAADTTGPLQRGRALALRQTTVYLGAALAGPAMGAAADSLGWEVAFLLSALASVTGAALLYPAVRAEDGARHAAPAVRG